MDVAVKYGKAYARRFNLDPDDAVSKAMETMWLLNLRYGDPPEKLIRSAIYKKMLTLCKKQRRTYCLYDQPGPIKLNDFEDIIYKLNVVQRHIMRRVFIHNYKQKEISQEIGISGASVNRYFHRALSRLREQHA